MMESEPEREISEEFAAEETPRLAERARPAGATAEPERPRRRGRGRRRVCIMCAEKLRTPDYKDASFLRRFISERGRIDTRRKTNCCAKHQRALAQAIKRARHLALLPYTADHIRGVGVGPAR